MAIRVYGHSDDLIEIEGEIRDEFPVVSDEATFVGLSDGTLLSVTYDGRWHVGVICKPPGSSVTVHRATDDEDDYSDIAEIESDRGFLWAVVGSRTSR